MTKMIKTNKAKVLVRLSQGIFSSLILGVNE